MKHDLVNSLIFNRNVLKTVSKKFDLTKYEIEILAIIESVEKLSKKGYCEMKDICAILPQVEDRMITYRSVKKLLERGFLQRAAGTTQRQKYKLVLAGTGIYVLREYSRLINAKIKEQLANNGKRANSD